MRQGQIREGGDELTGMSSWIQFYKEEQAGNLTYGFSDIQCGVSDASTCSASNTGSWALIGRQQGLKSLSSSTRLLLFQNDLIEINAFSWSGATNPISSLWIGRSPELDIALLTVCFQVRRNQV